MIFIDAPCCDTPMAVTLPLPDSLRCEECSTIWDVAVEPPAEVALAA